MYYFEATPCNLLSLETGKKHRFQLRMYEKADPQDVLIGFLCANFYRTARGDCAVEIVEIQSHRDNYSIKVMLAQEFAKNAIRLSTESQIPIISIMTAIESDGQNMILTNTNLVLKTIAATVFFQEYSTVFYDEKNNVTSLSQLKANAGNGYVIAKKSV